MKELNEIIEYILEHHSDIIKKIEFGERKINGVSFSVTYPININDEQMTFSLTSELIQDIKFSAHMYNTHIDTIKETSILIVEEYKNFRESRRRSNEEKA